MTARSTRNKIRFQGQEALSDLKRAQIHTTQLAALAADTSPYIDDNLPVIMLALSAVIDTLDKFNEGL
jgi:hypothetical protein